MAVAVLERPKDRENLEFWERPRTPDRRVRTGWVVQFRELALTRIPVKITTPSLLF
jgi:hypothetical protein